MLKEDVWTAEPEIKLLSTLGPASGIIRPEPVTVIQMFAWLYLFQKPTGRKFPADANGSLATLEKQ
ncbi:MAG TPA: hypothetical protein PLX89_18175 [Verrucomicrobiota bacterium]|nr:hypothetical protein [Verrucomicrobiales bacterium]HRI14927.1 hypothetical protein [Verrucomicrobiota bacterium]